LAEHAAAARQIAYEYGFGPTGPVPAHAGPAVIVGPPGADGMPANATALAGAVAVIKRSQLGAESLAGSKIRTIAQ
jgi:hypothetical protein